MRRLSLLLTLPLFLFACDTGPLASGADGEPTTFDSRHAASVVVAPALLDSLNATAPPTPALRAPSVSGSCEGYANINSPSDGTVYNLYEGDTEFISWTTRSGSSDPNADIAYEIYEDGVRIQRLTATDVDYHTLSSWYQVDYDPNVSSFEWEFRIVYEICGGQNTVTTSHFVTFNMLTTPGDVNISGPSTVPLDIPQDWTANVVNPSGAYETGRTWQVDDGHGVIYQTTTNSLTYTFTEETWDVVGGHIILTVQFSDGSSEYDMHPVEANASCTGFMC